MVVRKYEGYSGRMICGTLLERWGGVWWEGDMRDMRDMRDGPPPRNRPGRAAVFGPTPPNPRRTGNRNNKRSTSQKRNAYFVFNLLIFNHINQYFNIRLHLIRFITYNRRIFIAKYLFENKTCSIFAYVKITLTNRRTRCHYKS